MKLIPFVILYGVFTITNALVGSCEELKASNFAVDKKGGGRVPCYICLRGPAAKPTDTWLVPDKTEHPSGLFAVSTCPDISKLPAGKELEDLRILDKYVWITNPGYGEGNKPHPQVFVNTAKKLFSETAEVLSVTPVWVEQWERTGISTGLPKNPCSIQIVMGKTRESTRPFALCFYEFDQIATKRNGVRGAPPKSRGRREKPGAPVRSATSAMEIEEERPGEAHSKDRGPREIPRPPVKRATSAMEIEEERPGEAHSKDRGPREIPGPPGKSKRLDKAHSGYYNEMNGLLNVFDDSFPYQHDHSVHSLSFDHRNNDVSGSGSPLLIGGVIGASSVIIIMLIFCLGLAFGLAIYWGYSQKRALQRKRTKEEIRWIEDENRNEV
eukprot:427232_1